jgi:hypothetical protein
MAAKDTLLDLAGKGLLVFAGTLIARLGWEVGAVLWRAF